MERYKSKSIWYADYSTDGEFFGELAAPLNEENFQRYKEMHSEERAAGYLEAIKDFQAEFRAIDYQGTPPKVRNYLRKLFSHNEEFLKGLSAESLNSSVDKPRL